MAKDESSPGPEDRVETPTRDALVAAIDSMDEGVLIWDARERCALRSPRILELLDMDEADLPIGARRADFRRARVASGDLASCAAERFVGAIEVGAGFDFDTVRPSGRVIETRARPIPGGGWVSTLTDVTESRRAEEERATLAARLDAVLSSMEQGLIVWDADGVCILRNSRAIALLEVEEGDLVPGIDRLRFIETLTAKGSITARDGAAVTQDYASGEAFGVDRVTPSGRVLACHARPLGDAGHVITLTDVTDERRASRRLAELSRSAARAEEDVRAALARETRRQREAALLAQVDEWLQTCRTEAELSRVLRRAMETALPGMHGGAFLRAEGGFERAIAWGRPEDAPADRMVADDCWALRRGRRYVYEPGAIGLPCRHYGAADRDRPAFCLPVVARGRTLGIVTIGEGEDAASSLREADTLGMTVRIAEHFGMAISNMRGPG